MRGRRDISRQSVALLSAAPAQNRPQRPIARGTAFAPLKGGAASFLENRKGHPMKYLFLLIALVAGFCFSGCNERPQDRAADSIRDRSQQAADETRDATQEQAEQIRDQAGRDAFGNAASGPAERAADRVEKSGERKADLIEREGERKADAVEDTAPRNP
jgi:hypothetical protein